MSQKQLADRLTERGMRVDAPAISRIESGGRSVRLTEALLIADALDTELEALATYARTPAQRLSRMRRLADIAMNELEEPTADFLNRLLDVRAMLHRHPELLSSLPDEKGTVQPDEPDDYLDWVRKRIEGPLRVQGQMDEDALGILLDSGQAVVVPDRRSKNELVELMAQFAAVHILIDQAAYEDRFDLGQDNRY